jgi:hypothetical protein
MSDTDVTLAIISQGWQVMQEALARCRHFLLQVLKKHQGDKQLIYFTRSLPPPPSFPPSFPSFTGPHSG